MTQNFWNDQTLPKIQGSFGSLSLNGNKVYVENKKELPVFLGHVDGFLTAFKHLSQNISFLDQKNGMRGFGDNHARMSHVQFLGDLKDDDLWSAWASFVTNPLLREETRQECLRVGPRRANTRMVFLDKKTGERFFEGSALDFFLDATCFFDRDKPTSLLQKQDLSTFLRGIFRGEQYSETINQTALFYFAKRLKDQNSDALNGIHILFEQDDTASSLMENPDFLSRWARSPKNAKQVLNALVESTMSVRMKKECAKILFSGWDLQKKEHAWLSMKCAKLPDRGLFTSWFALGEALFDDPKTIVRLSRDELRHAIAKRADKPSDWAGVVSKTSNTDLFSETEKQKFMQTLWEHACGHAQYPSISRHTFLRNLSEMERETKALLKHKLAPLSFEWDVFSGHFLKIVEQSEKSGEFDLARAPIFLDGKAMIERAFLKDQLKEITDNPDRPSALKRKM